jgi:single-strand DNA-binding protein
MAQDMNQCNFTGRLGKPPEYRYMPNGDPVCSFSIAVGSSYKDKAGQKVEQTEWVNITAFAKLAEICQQYLVKGSQVRVTGRMKTDEYEKGGIKRYSTKIIASDVQMLGSKTESAQSDNKTHTASRAAMNSQAPVGGVSNGFDDMDDDIPFAFNMNTVSDAMGAPTGLMKARNGKRMLLLQANKADF